LERFAFQVVLPDSYDSPAGVCQGPVSLSVSLAVARNLGRPIPIVDLVPASPVVGAPVPETAVDKNCQPGRAKDNVSLSAQAWQRCPVKAVTQADTVEGLTQYDFWRSTFASLGAHPRPHRFV